MINLNFFALVFFINENKVSKDCVYWKSFSSLFITWHFVLKSSIILLTTVSSNSIGIENSDSWVGPVWKHPSSWLHFGAEFLIVLIGHNSRLVIGHISWPVIGHNRWPISDEQCNFDPLLFCCKIKRRAKPWGESHPSQHYPSSSLFWEWTL